MRQVQQRDHEVLEQHGLLGTLRRRFRDTGPIRTYRRGRDRLSDHRARCGVPQCLPAGSAGGAIKYAIK
jgi:hypothetical protein